jgi:hypothetical protein
MSGDYEVGKWKTPKGTRFKPGQSGNPKGRPPKKRPDAASVVAILDESIAVRQGGTARKMSAFEVSVRKLVTRALNEGEVQAALEFLRLCDKYEVITPAPEPITSGVLTVPKSWIWDEWMEMFNAHGPPPWPGKRSGLVE